MSFVRVTDSVNSWVRFTMPSSGVLTWYYEIRTTDTSGGALANFQSGTFVDFWRSAWAAGSTSTLTRTTNLRVNGATVSGTTTRAQLATLLCTGNWVTVQYTAHSKNGSEASTATFAAGDLIEFANYFPDAGSCPNADIRNFKVSVGNTGSWTHESYLGSGNGFDRQNVTVFGDGQPINAQTLVRPAGDYRPQSLVVM